MKMLSAYETVIGEAVPLMGQRKCDGSTAGADGEVILSSGGANAGASFTTSLLYRRKAVKHIFVKKEQVAVKCPEGCKHAFVLPCSLFETVVFRTSWNLYCSDGKGW